MREECFEWFKSETEFQASILKLQTTDHDYVNETFLAWYKEPAIPAKYFEICMKWGMLVKTLL